MHWLLYVSILLVLFKLYQVLTCGMCKYNGRLDGKVAIVTGANTGIGYETAKDFAKRGARVILACRNEERGIEAQNRIIEDTGNKDVSYRKLDLSSLASVRKFVKDTMQSEDKLHILVNNAGAAAIGGSFTEDGIVEDMQINHFGPFLLTLLLLPLLKKGAPSRIVNVSSLVHFLGTVDFDHINKESSYYALRIYANSKLCNILFTRELAHRLKGTNIVVNCLHPGSVNTEIHRATPTVNVMYILNKIFFKNAYEGAQTTIYCAVDPECENVSGKYFMDCKSSMISWPAANKKLAKRLWDYSAELVKVDADELVNKVVIK